MMNLTKLFDMQRDLDAHIMDEHPELKGQNNLDWKILALQVELGECANEWRGFKKWSHDQEPRTHKRVTCHACKGHVEFNYPVYHGMHHVDDKTEVCTYCEGTGIQEECNPLLEEYVDCLHFILSIGLELGFTNLDIWIQERDKSVIDQFNEVFHKVTTLNFLHEVDSIDQTSYSVTVHYFLSLGAALGFTWEQIEEAYMKKNKINHKRQENQY